MKQNTSSDYFAITRLSTSIKPKLIRSDQQTITDIECMLFYFEETESYLDVVKNFKINLPQNCLNAGCLLCNMYNTLLYMIGEALLGYYDKSSNES